MSLLDRMLTVGTSIHARYPSSLTWSLGVAFDHPTGTEREHVTDWPAGLCDSLDECATQRRYPGAARLFVSGTFVLPSTSRSVSKACTVMMASPRYIALWATGSTGHGHLPFPLMHRARDRSHAHRIIRDWRSSPRTPLWKREGSNQTAK